MENLITKMFAEINQEKFKTGTYGFWDFSEYFGFKWLFGRLNKIQRIFYPIAMFFEIIKKLKNHPICIRQIEKTK